MRFARKCNLRYLIRIRTRNHRWGMAACALALVSVLSGCGWFSEDNTRPPANLPNFEPTLKVQKVWSRSVGDGIGKQYLRFYPLIAGDRLFTTDSEGRVTALSLEGGKKLWATSLDVDASAGVNGNEEVVAIGTAEGDVIVLDANEGQELWRTRLSSEVTALAPADLGILVARTNDSKVYGLDVVTGEVIWQSGQTAPLLLLKGQSVPVLAEGLVVVGYDSGKVAAISMVRGNVVWQVTGDVPEGASELERMVDIDGVIRVSDGVVYAVAYHGRVVGLSLDSGRVLWSRDFSSYEGLDVDRSKVYLTDESSDVWALDRSTGGSIWKQDQLKFRQVTAPVVIGDYVVVGDFEGYVHWLDKEDGHFVARTRVDGDGVLSPPVIVDGRAYVLGNSGSITVLEPESEYGSDF